MSRLWVSPRVLTAQMLVFCLTGSVASGEIWSRAAAPYQAPAVRPVALTNSPRLSDLIRAGNLYLSLEDAIALAIENNLDIEYQRYNRTGAQSEILRAKGGGTTRGLNLTAAEAPSGVGGPAAPLVTSPAARTVTGSTVSTNPIELGGLGQVQTNLSITGSVAPSAGPPIPVFDPFVSARFNWQHQSTPQSNALVTGISNLVSETTTGSAGFRQGFGPGTQVGVAFDNSYQTLNSLRTSYSPFNTSALGLTVIQPLLRGFGLAVNRRYISIARNENRMADALFRHQLIISVYGVSRLYYDFVALFQDVRVKEQSLTFAQRLLQDTQSQFEQGTAAQVEVSRANAQVFSARQELERSQGLLEEQEAVLKTYLSRQGISDLTLQTASIIPTTQNLDLPPEQPRPVGDLMSEAMSNRGDVEVAQLQVANLNISLEGSRNALRPQVDLVGIAQNVGLAGQPNALAMGVDPTFVGGYGSALGQVFARHYPVYGAGIQLDLPVRNRVAQADAARDQVLVRQSEIRLQQLRNQVRLEIEDALIALRRARTAWEAAVEARKLQEQSLEIEQARYSAGVSTSFFVLQYQSLLAQARSSEVVSRNAYVKAQTSLQRALGTILGEHGISIEKAVEGRS